MYGFKVRIGHQHWPTNTRTWTITTGQFTTENKQTKPKQQNTHTHTQKKRTILNRTVQHWKNYNLGQFTASNNHPCSDRQNWLWADSHPGYTCALACVRACVWVRMYVRARVHVWVCVCMWVRVCVVCEWFIANNYIARHTHSTGWFPVENFLRVKCPVVNQQCYSWVFNPHESDRPHHLIRTPKYRLLQKGTLRVHCTATKG